MPAHLRIGIAVAGALVVLPLACGTEFTACEGEACGTTTTGGTTGLGGNSASGTGGSTSTSTTTSASGDTSGTSGSTTGGGEAGESGLAGAAGAGGDPGAGGAGPLPCDGACEGATPVCDEEQDSCVQCLESSSDCEAPMPFCGDAHECVECLDNLACPEPTESKCDDGTCSPCQTNEDCTHIEGKGVCDEGECVECTGTDYAACGTNDELEPLVCDSLTRTCSTQARSSAGLCASCVSDAACETGMLCIRERYLPDGVDLGYVCAWQRGAEGAPSLCADARPYVQARTALVSIDGTQGNMCVLAVSTCAAHADFRSTNCETETPDTVDNDLCGETALDDGICQLSESAGDNVYRCSVPCVGDDDCPENFDCDTNASPQRCELDTGN